MAKKQPPKKKSSTISARDRLAAFEICAIAATERIAYFDDRTLDDFGFVPCLAVDDLEGSHLERVVQFGGYSQYAHRLAAAAIQASVTYYDCYNDDDDYTYAGMIANAATMLLAGWQIGDPVPEIVRSLKGQELIDNEGALTVTQDERDDVAVDADAADVEPAPDDQGALEDDDDAPDETPDDDDGEDDGGGGGDLEPPHDDDEDEDDDDDASIGDYPTEDHVVVTADDAAEEI